MIDFRPVPASPGSMEFKSSDKNLSTTLPNGSVMVCSRLLTGSGAHGVPFSHCQCWPGWHPCCCTQYCGLPLSHSTDTMGHLGVSCMG